MPLELDDILGVLFLSPEAFTARARSFGVDLTGVQPEEVKSTLALASRAVEAHCGRSFAPDSLTETHRWDPRTRRVSVNQPPVMAVESFSIKYAPGASADIRIADVIVNNQANYLEVASLSVIAGLPAAVEALELTEALVEVKYKTYQAVPPAAAAATGFVAAHFLQQSEANDMLPAGLVRSKVGSEDLSRSRAAAETDIPLAAQLLLRQFRRIAIA